MADVNILKGQIIPPPSSTTCHLSFCFQVAATQKKTSRLDYKSIWGFLGCRYDYLNEEGETPIYTPLFKSQVVHKVVHKEISWKRHRGRPWFDDHRLQHDGSWKTTDVIRWTSGSFTMALRFFLIQKEARCSTIELEKKKPFVIVGAVCRLMPTNTEGQWKTYDVTR
ncbi:hypothetical protein GQR58_022499 [Nymphon striatum]|nr:hypothetical protein GQR58_022499 [Nymphon striatum]